MTAFSIVISVIVLDLHHHEPTEPPPRWLRYLVFNIMARVTCQRTPYSNESSSLFQIAHGRMRQSARQSSNRSNHNHHNSVAEEDEEERIMEENHVTNLHVMMKGLYDDLEAVMAPKKKKPLFDEILQHLRDITTKMKRNIKREQIKEEWKMVAKVMDRFLLVVFLIAIVGLTVSILYIYPQIAVISNPQRGGVAPD